MKTLEMNKATRSLGEYARKLRRDPLVLTENGKPVAALVSVRNADPETISLSTNLRFIGIIQRSRAALKARGGISPDQMRRRLRVGRRDW